MAEKYIQNKEVFQSKIGEEVVMLDVDSGFYFSLNSVASYIWSLMKDEIEFDSLIDSLIQRYEIERSVCISDTRDILAQMLEKKIIKQCY